MLVSSLLVCVCPCPSIPRTTCGSLLFLSTMWLLGRQPQVIRLDGRYRDLLEEPFCQPEAEFLSQSGSLWAESTMFLKGLFS